MDNTDRTFAARIQEIELHARFVNNSKSIERQIAFFINREVLNTAPNLEGEYNSHYNDVKEINEGDLRAGLIVQAFAAFEWYLGSILRTASEELVDGMEVYQDLPPKIIQKHITLAGRVLAIQPEAKKHLKIDIDEFCKRLGSCYHGSKQFQINSQVFSMFIPNLNKKSIVEILDRLNYSWDFSTLGDTAAIKKITGENSKKKAGKAASELFGRLSLLRNEVAHRGDGSVSASEEDLSHCLILLKCMAEQISIGLKNQIGKTN